MNKIIQADILLFENENSNERATVVSGTLKKGKNPIATIFNLLAEKISEKELYTNNGNKVQIGEKLTIKIKEIRILDSFGE